MKNLNILIFVILVFSPSFLLAEPETALRVGVIVPFTGDSASFGESVKNGMTLAYEKLPAEAKSKLKLIYEDDAMSSMRTVSAFNKLLSTDKIALVVNFSSGTANALAPLAESRKVPMIAIASDPKIVEGRRYVVNFWVTPLEEAKIALPEIKRRGYRRIARISSMQDGVLAVREAFDEVNQGQVEVVLDEEYPIEVKDFRTYITKLKSRNDIDAVCIILLPGHCGLFAKQLRRAGIELPIFGFEMLEDSNEVKFSGGALHGAWYVNADDASEEFTKEYRERFPEALLFGASSAHDIILLLARAVEINPNPELINDFLHTVQNFSGALGTYSASGDSRFTLPAAVKEVTKEGFRKLKRR